MYRPQGVISSMVTSFKPDGTLDEEGLRKNIRFQREAGVPAVCVLGGTGEPLALTRQERERVISIAVEAAEGELDVVVGAMAGGPDEVAKDIAYAARAGAKACMVVAPPFVRPAPKDVKKYFATLAAGSEVPLIVFNVPSRSGFLMSASFIAELARDIDMIVGVKESSRDIVLLSDVRALCPPPFAVLQGVDALFLPSLALGADGGLIAAAAVFPEWCVEIDKAVREGDLARARERHYQLMQLVPLLYEASHPGPLKAAIEMRGLPAGSTRPPLYELTEDHMGRLRACMQQLLASA